MTKKSPLAGMGFAQKIATITLAVLALIALVAVLAGGGGRGASSSTPSAGSTSAGSDATSRDGSGGASTGSSPHASGHSSAATTRNRTGQTDALASVSVDDLPREAKTTLGLIDSGGPYPYRRDGIVFSNREGVLPKHPRGWYHEYTVRTPGESDRGTRRLVQGKDGTIYYSDDHYRSFRRVQR